MIGMSMLFARTGSAESVTQGHPDKVADQIADAIVDEAIKINPESRVAIEMLAGHGQISIGGEMTIPGNKGLSEEDIKDIALTTYHQIGYQDTPKVDCNIVMQSQDIALGVDRQGAGDQGCMVGFATNQTEDMLPLPFYYARQLTLALTRARLDGTLPWAGPDGKSLVVMKDGEVEAVTIAIMHSEDIGIKDLRRDVRRKIIQPVLGKIPPVVKINQTGRFVQGGLFADAGVVGRKIVVDAYGPQIPVGGGAFSGKDPTKVDRSAAYMARFVAKNIIAHQVGGVHVCTVFLAYVIGDIYPVEIDILTNAGRVCMHRHQFVDSTMSDFDVSGSGYDITNFVTKYFDFSPVNIIKRLGLQRPIYKETARLGHFGYNHYPWEQIIEL